MYMDKLSKQEVLRHIFAVITLSNYLIPCDCMFGFYTVLVFMIKMSKKKKTKDKRDKTFITNWIHVQESSIAVIINIANNTSYSYFYCSLIHKRSSKVFFHHDWFLIHCLKQIKLKGYVSNLLGRRHVT